MAKTAAKVGTKSRTREAAKSQADRSPEAGDVLRGPAFTRKNYSLLGAGLVVVAVGFFALAHGSTTLAPFLIVLGYLVLVPLAILRR